LLFGLLAAYALLVFTAPLVIWLLIFVPQPHKEERSEHETALCRRCFHLAFFFLNFRFLFPIYTLVCLAAALALQVLSATLAKLTLPRLGTALVWTCVLTSSAISVSRTAALYQSKKTLHPSFRPHNHTHTHTL
jgi:hypothetical protein